MATANQSTGRFLFEAAASGGAQAAGRSSGQITEGKIADLMAVSTDNEFLCNRLGDTVLDSLVFTGRGRGCVTDVWRLVATWSKMAAISTATTLSRGLSR